MSLPTPSISATAGGAGITMDPQQLQAMEAPLIALANSAGGDLRKLLYAFFSFLHRRTDFYLVPNELDLKEGKAKMGFPEGEAEKLLLAAFRQFPLRRIPRQHQQPQAPQTTTTTLPKSTSAATTSKPEESTASAGDTSSTIKTPEQGTNKDTMLENQGERSKNNNNSKPKKKKDGDETVRYTEEGLQIPIGNGGSTKRYKWTQTIDECTVLVGVPEGTRAKDLDVSIKPTSIHVKTKNKPQDGNDDDDDKINSVTTFVEGTLVEKIKPDESTWSLESGVIIMILYKIKKTFWATVIEGDEKIDTSLVDSRRHISEYDEATQGQLRKIMFDQKQQEKGLPTSDELLGTKTIPPLPPGVEYIDKTTFEKVDQNKK